MNKPQSAYPIDPWKIRETSYDPAMIARNESIFALGNGNLGLRGNFEEGSGNATVGTYINGFFEETPIVYGEIAYGYAKNRQVMLNVADGKVIRLFVGDEPFDLRTGSVLAYERSIDLRELVLVRTVRWRSPAGREIELTVRRLVSLERPEVAAIDFEVEVVAGEGALRFESEIDGRVTNRAGADDPRIGAHFRERPLSVRDVRGDALFGELVQETKNSRMALACAADHAVEFGGRGREPAARGGRAGGASAPAAAHAAHAAGADDGLGEGRRDHVPGWRSAARAEAERAVVSIEVARAGGERTRVRLTKYLAYCTTLDGARGELAARARAACASAKAAGFDALVAEQRAAVDRFWQAADIELDGDGALQQSIRFNLASLFQSAGRSGRTSIAAKGLSGEGYEGHYFWDTEIYVQPFFVYAVPEIARALVRYRCSILDKARSRAREMSQRGALFPWRTIGGEETSPYYPAGTAQYHINADIVFAFRKYMLAAEDRDLLLERGAEMVFESARLYADLGRYIPEKNGDFCIDEVTGPDEYTALVNNNLYTNLMAQANLEYAVELATVLRVNAPAEYARIAGAIGLEAREVDGWREAAAKMHLPFDREKGIHAQDDLFLTRPVWDFEHTPRESYPLLLHYHPLVIYRHQVLKQPDVVLAQVLRGDRFSLAEKKRNFEYYDAITTGDSSLSPCIQSVAASELGDTEKAYAYFMRTARMDLDDVNGNVADGLHTAAMAGTWISLVYGFAGMRDYDGELSFNPRLPEHLNSLRFRLRFRGRILDLFITHRDATYRLLEGGPLRIRHRGAALEVTPEAPVSRGLKPQLECVVFDLDGVITDTAELHFRAWKRLADELGVPFDRSTNERLKGVSRMESLEIILEQSRAKPSAEEKRALAERKNGYYKELIKTITPADLLPGIAELVHALHAEGIKTAVASVSHNVWEVVDRLEIAKLVDLIVDPASVVKGKPDPEIFLRAAEALGVPVEHCAGVEDARAGVQAIKAARMFAIGIGRELPESDWLLPDTSRLTLAALRREFERWAERAVAGLA